MFSPTVHFLVLVVNTFSRFGFDRRYFVSLLSKSHLDLFVGGFCGTSVINPLVFRAELVPISVSSSP